MSPELTTERSALTSYGVTLFVPVGLQNGDVAVAATGTLKIDDRAQVQAGSGSAGAVVQVGPTSGGTTQVGADTVLPTLWSAAPATLGDRAHVSGAVLSNSTLTKGNSVVISGTVTSAPNTVLPRAVAWSVGLPPTSSGSVTVNSGSQSISPGRYGSITVNSQGTLTLSTGFYFADSLTLNAAGTLQIDDSAGPVTLYVLSGLTDHGTVTGKSSSTPNFVLAYLGTSSIVFDSQFSGAIVAPRASVTYRPSQSSILGGIFAQDVEIGAGVVLQSRPSSALAADIAGAGDPGSVSPLLEGLATLGPTTFAVFGYQNAASQNVHNPYGAQNHLSTPAGTVGTPNPAPPEWFLPGTHPGALVYPFAASSLTWTLGTHSATATSSSTHLTITTGTQGQGVTIGGTFVLLEASPANNLQGSIVPTTDNGSPTTVGNTDVSFTVSSDGAALMNIPLWVSPGRANMQPTLSLQYNSREGEGSLAYKWDLTGLPEITRCLRTRARDGQNAEIAFDDTDVFCLDGNKLVLETGNGGDGSTFRLEHDTFARIILHQQANGPASTQPDTFEMRTKDGRIFTFGASDAILAGNVTNITVTGPSFGRMSWAVHQVADRSGNTVTFHYQNTSTGCSERYISEIDYTGSTTDGVDSPQRSVVFSTQARPDVRTSYANSLCTRRSVLFNHIKMYGPAPSADGSGNVVKALLRQYNLAYTNDARTTLSTVTECDGSGICKAPVTLNYPEPSDEFDAYPLNLSMDAILSTSSPNRTKTLVAADLNGDGFDDLVYLTNSTAPNQLEYQLSTGSPATGPFSDAQIAIVSSSFALSGPLIVPVDIDMDGRADLLLSGLDGNAIVLHNDGGTPLHFTRLSDPDPTKIASIHTGFGDIDGDGLPDLISYALGHSNPADGSPVAGLSAFPNLGGHFNTTTGGPIFFAGFLAIDPDVVINPFYVLPFLDNKQQTQVLSGEVAVPGVHLDAPFQAYYFPDKAESYQPLSTTLPIVLGDQFGSGAHMRPAYFFPDLNGDGLPDAAVAVAPASDGLTPPPLSAPFQFLNVGRAAFVQAPQQPGFPGGFLQGPTGIDPLTYVVPVDFDQDGFQDALVLKSFNPANAPNPPPGPAISSATPGFVLRSVGDGTFAPEGNFVSTFDKTRDNQLGTITPFQVLDFDGDGLPDLVGADSSGVTHAYQHHGLPVGLLTSFSDSLGKQTSVTYKPIRQVSPLSSGCSYPQYCVNQGMWFVSDVKIDNGLESTKTQAFHDQYSYSGAASDLTGRGWLGVASRTVQRFPVDAPSTASIQTVTTYQNTALAGNNDGQIGHFHDYPLQNLPATETITHFNKSNQLQDNVVTRATSYNIISGSIGSFYAVAPSAIDDSDADTAHGPNVPNPNRQTHAGPFVYDPFGNVSSEVVTDTLATGSTIKTTILGGYLNDTQNWLVSQPTGRTITSQATTGTTSSTASRNWIFTPETGTGRLKHITYQQGLPNEQLDTDYTLDVHGLPKTITRSISTGESRSSGISYDDVDGTFPKLETNALGQPFNFTYHPGIGVLVDAKDANGLHTSRDYDGLGRLRSFKGPDGTGFQVHYEGTSVLLGAYQVRVTHDAGGEDIQTLDDWERTILASQKDFTGAGTNNISITYDANQVGLAARLTVPTSGPPTSTTPVTSLAYDSLGELTEEATPEGFFVERVYSGTEVRITDPAENIYDQLSDGRSRVLRVQEGPNPNPITTGYTYGPFGLPATLKDSKQNVTQFTYDASGRKVGDTSPDTGSSSYTWNGFGDLIQVTDANNDTVTLVPDPLGRTAESFSPDGATVYRWDSSPNGIGRLGSSTSPDNVDCTYGYDSTGRLNSQAWTLRAGNPSTDGTYSIGISYDGAGRPSIITYPAVGNETPVQIQRKYFSNGTLSNLVRVSTGKNIWTVNSRTPRDQVGDETAGNGVETVHSYDAATGLVREIKSMITSQTIRDATYSYDPARRLQLRTIDGQTEHFGYDKLNRLTSWEEGNSSTNPGVTYSYDDIGNMTARTNTTFTSHVPTGVVTGQVTFTPGDGVLHGPHQLVSSSTGAYTYDLRGDQKTAPGRATTYTNVGLPHAITSNDSTTTFAYDANWARVLKTSATTTIVSLGGLYERRVTGNQTNDVFYAVDAGRPVAQITITENGGAGSEQPTLYLHDDHLGSIQMVTTASGQVSATQSFDPFGARVGSIATGVRLGFDGLEEDDDLGLVNMSGRVYDPAQARFVTADPLLNLFLSQGLNPYAFVRNNPINAIDPTGLEEEAPPPFTAPPSIQDPLPSPPPPPSDPNEPYVTWGTPAPAPPASPPPAAPAPSTDPTIPEVVNGGGPSAGTWIPVAGPVVSGPGQGPSGSNIGGGGPAQTPGTTDVGGSQSPGNAGASSGRSSPTVVGLWILTPKSGSPLGSFLNFLGLFSQAVSSGAGAVAAGAMGSPFPLVNIAGQIAGLRSAASWLPTAAYATAIANAAGWTAVAIGVGQGIADIATGRYAQGVGEIGINVGSVLGARAASAWAGGAIGAAYGGEIGLTGGIATAAAGALVGGIIGGVGTILSGIIFPSQ